jgi:hypothetical protein
LALARGKERMKKFMFIAPTALKSKQEARQYAIDYQNWASEQNLSYGELSQYQGMLKTVGRKFGLLKEFKENGIL